MDVRRALATETVVRGGRVLLTGKGLVEADIVCDGGRIVEIGRGASYAGARVVDANRALVLPGIVDIHGDAFERQIMPRPHTMFPLDIAMAETDRQLAANGITTAYHGVTVSWEPGLRSLERAQAIVQAISAAAPGQRVDHRIHVRWETFAIDEVPAVIEMLSALDKAVLAFNDHTGPSLDGKRKPSKMKESADRAMMDEASYLALLEAKAAQRDEVDVAVAVLAKVARDQNVPMLSHDDTSSDMRAAFRARGARIAEFPMNWEAAADAKAHGDHIVMGAPNVVRGGSHNGAIGAEDAIRKGLCTILASDYYYPSLLEAALTLHQKDVLPLEDAWRLVAETPAFALGLEDRGAIAIGKRADIIVVDEARRHVVATVSEGRVVYQSVA